MIAVVQTGGKQYKVSEGDEIQVEKLDGKVGESINLEKVLVCGEGESTKVGTPFLEGCSAILPVFKQHFRDSKSFQNISGKSYSTASASPNRCRCSYYN